MRLFEKIEKVKLKCLQERIFMVAGALCMYSENLIPDWEEISESYKLQPERWIPVQLESTLIDEYGTGCENEIKQFEKIWDEVVFGINEKNISLLKENIESVKIVLRERNLSLALGYLSEFDEDDLDGFCTGTYTSPQEYVFDHCITNLTNESEEAEEFQEIWNNLVIEEVSF